VNVITRQDILAHQTEVPWPLIYQVTVGFGRLCKVLDYVKQQLWTPANH
jgi:hypothetical protein